MGTLVSGSYEGIHSLAESIKEEFISPTDLEAYNKTAIGDKDKLVLVKEKIGNVYDVRNVYSKEHLEALLNGPHGSRYRRNIAHVEHLKASISHDQKEDVSSLDKDAERNADKVHTDTQKKVADVKGKEAAEATNAEEEQRQKELGEARIAADLQEQEQEGHLDADAAIREDD